MVICIDKATAVRMYDKVKKHWDRRIIELRAQLELAQGETKEALAARIKFMEQTDMAVIVSQSQNEIRDLEAKGLDIRPHRKRMFEEDMEKKFKDPADPFRLVFVCAMWMTGFDVPSCSTLYLDKPMRNHTLMQTIARANRVFRDKVNGLIVDYAGVFRNLEKALAIYGAGDGKGTGKPVEDKKALVAALKHAIQETTKYCQEQGVLLQQIKDAQGFEGIGLIDDAVDFLVTTDEVKSRYLDQAAWVTRLYKAILPDKEAQEFLPDYSVMHLMAEKIRSLTPPADITRVMQDVEALLDRSIAPKGYVFREQSEPYGSDNYINLSEIDFEELKKKFEEGRKHTEIEKLKSAISKRLYTMIRQNRTRMDYYEKFQQLIEDYNSGSINVEEFFRRLVAFTRELTVEEQRAISEELSEEELAIFDLLTKPEIKLSPKERKQVKAAARELLDVLKREKLVLDWRKRQKDRAQVRVTIETLLDQGLPEVYTAEIFQTKTNAVYQHIYESYFGAGRSIYSLAV